MDSNISRDIIKPLRECLDLVFPPVMPLLIRETSKATPDFEEMTRIVSIDPGLTVTIMSLANSPYYGLSHKISDLKRAMVVLGTAEILKLAISVTMKKSISSKMGKCRHVDFRNWSVILWSAMAGELVARELNLKEADALYICALVKDLSLLLICCSEDPRLKKHANLCNREMNGIVSLYPGQLDEEEKAWGVNHAQLTMDLLSYWGFPRGDCDMLASHHDLENIKAYDRVRQVLILATSWAEVEMNNNEISQLLRIRSIAKNILGLEEDAFERIRGNVSTRFKSMCDNLGLLPGENDVSYHDFPVTRIQDLYLAAQELHDVQGDLYDAAMTIAKHLYWLWGLDDFLISLVSPMTDEPNFFHYTRTHGLKAFWKGEAKSARLSGAGIQFYLKDRGYLSIKSIIQEDVVAEIDLYSKFLCKNFESYFYRARNTLSKARLMDYMPVAVARLSRAGKVIQVNRRFMELFNLTQDPEGQDFWPLAKGLIRIEEDSSWQDFMHPASRKFSKLFCPLEPRMEKKDASCWHLTAHKVKMDGVDQILVMFEDVAEIAVLEKDIIRQGDFLRGIINSMQDMVITLDEKGTILFASPDCKDELVGKNFFSIASPSSVMTIAWGPEILPGMDMPVEVDLFIDNTGKSLELIFNRLSGPPSPQYLVVGRDLTAIRRLEEKIKKQAAFDHLTRVFNRHQFSIFFEREVQRAGRKEHGLGLIFFDLDKFKEFNDRYGHQIGDEALRDFGRLLISNSRRGMDFPCRYGGDEFVLLVTETSVEGMEGLVKRLLRSFEQDSRHKLTLSIGMAIMAEGETKEEFLERADRALFEAKKINKNAYLWAKTIRSA